MLLVSVLGLLFVGLFLGDVCFAAGEFGPEGFRAPPLPDILSPACLSASFLSGTIAHFIPLPGSSVRLGILTKSLFNDRLCRIEFYRMSVMRHNLHLQIGRRQTCQD